MFKCKKDQIHKEQTNVFGIVYDILTVGYNAYDRDHDSILWQVMQIFFKKTKIK